MARIWLLMLLAALCGCQQKETPAVGEAPPATQPSATPDTRPALACFGDSLTAGQGLDAGQSFPGLLQRELDQRGYRYRVVNFGESGDTTGDGLARLGTVLAEKPAIVVLELGANDGLRGQPVAGAQNNLGQMIEAFQSARVPVVLAGMTLPPNYGPDYIRRFEAMYKALAEKYKLPLIPFLLEGVAGHGDLMQRDGLHPNAAGTRIVESTVFRALEPLLRKD